MPAPKLPLTIISGYLNLIDRGKYGEVPHGMADAIHVSLGKVQELSELIEKVLAYAGLTATELERAGQLVVLDDLLRRIHQRIEQRYPGRTIDWRLSLPGGVPRARAPEELLSVVVDNLVDNAVKFTRQNDARVEIAVREIEDRQLEIAVRDNGPGIRPQDRDQVFSDFSQLEETFTGNITGMGLGLATAKRLVESWGGHINFESTPGQGSVFLFTVPSEFTPARDSADRHSA